MCVGVGGECSRPQRTEAYKAGPTQGGLLDGYSVELRGTLPTPQEQGYDTSRSQPGTPSFRDSGEDSTQTGVSPRPRRRRLFLFPSALPPPAMPKVTDTTVSLSSLLPKVGWFQTHISALPGIHKT